MELVTPATESPDDARSVCVFWDGFRLATGGPTRTKPCFSVFAAAASPSKRASRPPITPSERVRDAARKPENRGVPGTTRRDNIMAL